MSVLETEKTIDKPQLPDPASLQREIVKALCGESSLLTPGEIKMLNDCAIASELSIAPWQVDAARAQFPAYVQMVEATMQAKPKAMETINRRAMLRAGRR